MRARLIALLILVILIGTPIGIYWYFMKANTASLALSVSPTRDFHVILDGTFSFSFLPLADKLLHFSFDCRGVCTLSPLPPLKYTLQIMSTGALTLTDTVILEPDRETQKSYTLIPELQMTEVKNTIDLSLGSALVENARTTLAQDLTLVGVSHNGRVYASEQTDTGNRIGILTAERFTTFYEAPVGSNVMLDASKNFFLLSSPEQKNTTVVSLDGTVSFSIPLTSVTAVYVGADNLYTIRTEDGVWSFDGENLSKNPRFTDFIDLSPTLRLGYIDKTDTQKLSLANIGKPISTLILLDRSTAQATVIKQDIDVSFFMTRDGIPMLVTPEGKIYTLLLPTF